MHSFLRLLVVGLLAAVGACAAPAAPTASPSATSPVPTSLPTATTGPTATLAPTPEPTTEPTAEPLTTPQPDRGTFAQDPPTPLLINSAVRVVVPELNLRERPWLGARVIKVTKADSILIVSGSPPFENDGYVWYHGVLLSATGKLPALPVGFFFGVGEPISGWFASTKGSTGYVARFEPRCPDTVDFEIVSAMLGAERLACFGDQTIEVEGTFGCAGCVDKLPGRYKPAWLAAHGVNRMSRTGEDSPLGLTIRFRPSLSERPAFGAIIRVRGHFRDAAAAECSIATFFPWYGMYDETAIHDVGPSVARQLCRQEFVVESYDEIGTDPTF